jgi:hypothetical protein
MCIKINKVGKQEIGIWWVQKRYPQYGIHICRLCPNIRFLQSTVTEKLWQKISWTDGRTDGRKDERTNRRTEVKQYNPPPRGSGVWLDICCIVCFTIHPYIMVSRFRLCRDSYRQATNHQWAYLLTLDTRQDMLIDWSLTFNGISLSVMWGSIFSIYQSPVSLLFKIGYTPRDCARLGNIFNCLA